LSKQVTSSINLLLEEFERRKVRNTSYSLRAFAKSLGISPAALSQTLAGKRVLGIRNARKIISRLSLAPREAQEFAHNLFPSSESNTRKLYSYKPLADDVFRTISDWYHYAILSLGEIHGSSSNPKWIAERLGIPQTTAEKALERLERLNLITLHKVGRSRKAKAFRQTGESITTHNDIPSAAIRSHHLQQLEKARDALIDIDVIQREFGSATIAIQKKDLSKAKEDIRKFREEFAEKFSIKNDAPEADRVYALNVQFFPLDVEI
jgi:uncharacterized protein (TIGR02147 family)